MIQGKKADNRIQKQVRMQSITSKKAEFDSPYSTLIFKFVHHQITTIPYSESP